ncbi:MAG TPA: hypothetical protein VKA32_06115, partial [Gammaproteobacteria bacterium]|nr:hypothetical protein [Gammaproteobacteria bacterium]
LHDYVDDELDPGTRLDVARHLAEAPSDRAAVEAYQTQGEALHLLYDEVLSEPVPDRLRAVLAHSAGTDRPGDSQPTPRPRAQSAWPRALVAAAAAVVLLVAGGATGWKVRGDLYRQYTQQLALSTFLRNAATSYTLYGNSKTPWSSPSVSDAKTFVSQFKQVAGTNIVAPDLEQSGYKFVGAWALPSDTGPAGQLLYENDKGNRVTVYFQVNKSSEASGLAPSFGNGESSNMPRQFTQQNNLSVYYWGSGSVSYALLGEMKKDALGAIADVIFNDAKT